MGKYRGLFILLSAVIWAVLLWGMSKVKPGVFEDLFQDKAIKVENEKKKEEKPPPPPPPPPKLPPPPPLVERKTNVKTNLVIDTPIERPVAENPPPPVAPPVYSPLAPPAPPPPPAPPAPPPPPPPPSCQEKDSNPTPITAFNQDIAYPARAQEEEIEGSATITSQVDANGNVTSNSISASNPVFNSSSVSSEAKRRKFKPARSDCKNVSGSYTYTVKFQLN